MIGPFNTTGLQQFHREFLGNIWVEIEAAQRDEARFVANQVARFPWKHSTGDLARKTETRIIRTSRGARLVIKNRKPSAWALEYGSGIHAGRGKYLIAPRRAKALRFVIAGRVFIRHRVMHPGVRATHFLYRSVMASESHEFQFLRSRLSQVSERFANRRI